MIYTAADSEITFAISNIMHFQAIGVICLILFGILYLLMESRSEYKYAVFFFLLFCANIALTYHGIVNK